MPEQVTLRPVREDDLPLLRALTQDPQVTGEFEQYGWYAPRLFQRSWEDNGLISADGGNLMVVCGDDVLGAVNWRRHDTAPASHCWALGIGLFPRARGRGYGTQAHRLLVDYLFAHTTVHRIEAATETGNIAEQKAVAGRGALQHPAHRSRRLTHQAAPWNPLATTLAAGHGRAHVPPVCRRRRSSDQISG